MESPVEALFGVGDGIRHRMGSPAGLSLEHGFSVDRRIYVTGSAIELGRGTIDL